MLIGCTTSPSAPAGAPVEGPSSSAPWWAQAVIYEVYVRSFADSDGDGQGDLRGLTEHLDTLSDGDPSTDTDLGVDAVWLMPIHPSPSPHGYDVTNYRAVHPDYGSLKDFDALIAEARRRDVKVVMDLVLNHTSSQHPWFKQARLQQGDKQSWYRFSDKAYDHRRPWDGAAVWHRSHQNWFYALFWSEMPDLNLEHEAVFDEMVEAARFWRDRGVAGFRIDAARYLVEQGASLADTAATHAFVRRFRQAVDPQGELLWLAEAWTDNDKVVPYAKAYDRAFDFELAAAIEQAISRQTPQPLLRVVGSDAHEQVPAGFFAAFTENHDRARLGSKLPAEALVLATALLLAQRSTVCLYYGQELGMRGGGHQGDLSYRTPMRWTAQAPDFGFGSPTPWLAFSPKPPPAVSEQQTDSASQWRATQGLIAARKALPAGGRWSAKPWQDSGLHLADGDFEAWFNLSGRQPLALPDSFVNGFDGRWVLFSHGLASSGEVAELAPYGTVWLRRSSI